MATVFIQGFLFYIVCRVVEEGLKTIWYKIIDQS